MLKRLLEVFFGQSGLEVRFVVDLDFIHMYCNVMDEFDNIHVNFKTNSSEFDDSLSICFE